jgi:gliding motility-associated-like protein
MASFSHATHLVGGYMSYRYVGPLPNGLIRYFVTLNIYRDCNQSDVQFDDRIEIGIHFHNTNKDLYNIANFPLLTRRKVEPPGNIDCDYYKKNVCIEEGFYQGNVDVAPSAVGYLLTYVRCCRNNQDNLPSDGSQPYLGQTYYCQIPPTSIVNSSPTFSGVPSPYMCARDTTNILNSAIDIDGDELVYKIALPYQGGSPTQTGASPTPPNNLKLPIDPVVYRPGYSFTQPFGAGGMADVNSFNGLTALFAPREGSYVIAIEVQEFRQGKLLSAVRLDLQILVLNCPPNNAPRITTSQVDYEVEAGAQICFDVSASDRDLDIVSILGKGDIINGTNGYKGPKATFSKNFAQGVVTSRFCWQTTCDLPTDRPYIFTAEAWDDGCPPKFDNKNFNITIKPFKGADGISGPDPVCNFSKGNIYTALNTKNGSTFEWTVTGGDIIGPSNGKSISVNWNVEGTGIVSVTEISQNGCTGEKVNRSISIRPSPALPKITGRDTVCMGVLNEPYSVVLNAGSSYKWGVQNGSMTSTAEKAQVTWNTKGQGQIWAVETTVNGCPSDTAFKYVNIRKPEPMIDGTYSVCPNIQGITYRSLGDWGSTYQWNILGGTQATGGNSNAITINWGSQGTGRIEVVETDRFGCKSDLVFTLVQKDYVLQGVTPVGKTAVCEFDKGVDYLVKLSEKSSYHWSIIGGMQVSGDTSKNIKVDWGAAGPARVGVQERSFDPVNMRVCSSAVNFIDVIKHPLPVADQIEGDMDLCQTTTNTTYQIIGFAGSVYQWRLNGNVQSSTSNTINILWNVPGTYTLSVLETTLQGCPGQWVDTTIYIRPKPTTQGIFGLQVLCMPDIGNAVYHVTGFLNSQYNWQISGGNILSGQGTDSVVIDWSNTRNATLEFHEISEYGCLGDSLKLPVYINDMQVELEVISVGFPDDRMHSYWKLGEDKINDQPFVIEKRKAGTGDFWQTAGEISPVINNYLDKPINTDEFPYEFRIRATDLCGNARLSDIHTNIWLSGQQSEEDLSLLLKFTPYLGWKNGVDRFELFKRSNGQNDFEFLSDVSPESSISLPNSVTSFQDCFRIKGYESGGNQKVTWSNDVCFYYTPSVFIPNAFTPNNDALNEGFKAVTIAVNKFELAVFNRWGEKVFETFQTDKAWDGIYNGSQAQAGVYMYTLKFTDFENRPYYKSGTVHLIR